MTTMTRDEFRADILDGLASLENTFLWLRMTDVQKAVAKAQAQYWQQAPDADLDRLLALVQSQPTEKTMKSITLTDAQKAKLTAAGINWQQLLTLLAQYGPQILQIILAILNGQSPAPAPAPKATAGCDHHACCYEVLDSALQTAALAADHCCQCCEGGA